MPPPVSITLLRTQTDARLVELTAAGHERAFDAIVDRYRRPLLRYASRFCKEDGRAEDVVQAALVSAWTALSAGTAVRDLRPWLYRIVHNGALNAMKKPGSDDAPLIEASDMRLGPEAAFEQREDVRQALDTIAGLPERQRAALLAVALEGRSHADVGQDLGINDTAVRQLVSRARASLRVAATAVTPWPVAVWIAGIGGPQTVDAATRVGEIAGGIGAGTLFGGGAMKAGAIIATAGAVAVGAPTVVHVAQRDSSPGIASPASTRSASDDGTTAGGGSVVPVADRHSGGSNGDSGSGSASGASDSRDDSSPDSGRGEDSGPRHTSRSGTGGEDRHRSRDQQEHGEDSPRSDSGDHVQRDADRGSGSGDPESGTSGETPEPSGSDDPKSGDGSGDSQLRIETESGDPNSTDSHRSGSGSDDPPATVTVPQAEPSS